MQNGSSFIKEEEPFIVTSSRKKRRKKINVNPKDPVELFTKQFAEMNLERWMAESIAMVHYLVEQVFASTPCILCLGLGSPASSREARAQLCFLVQLRDALNIEPRRITIYDPIFSAEDNTLLQSLNIWRLSENKRGMYTFTEPTIAFMPHCDKHLYENILRANWTRDTISNVLFIGNRLGDYVESTASNKLHSQNPCIARIAPYIVEKVLPEYSTNPIAFNCTAAQFIQVASLPTSEDNAFWQLPAPITEYYISEAGGIGTHTKYRDHFDLKCELDQLRGDI